MKPYQPVVAALLNTRRPHRILDAPCGSGWLLGLLDYPCEVDGVDLFAASPPGYRSFQSADLDGGLPESLGSYDAVVSCEGIEHFGNPRLFLTTVRRHLAKDGLLIVSTPNTWHPAARLQYLLRGFFPGFPSLAGRIQPGTHMHVIPWSFPQLFLHLRLAGFEGIALHAMPEPGPKRAYEWLLGAPQLVYCRSKRRSAQNEEEARFWSDAGSRQSLFDRRLVISANAA